RGNPPPAGESPFVPPIAPTNGLSPRTRRLAGGSGVPRCNPVLDGFTALVANRPRSRAGKRQERPTSVARREATGYAAPVTKRREAARGPPLLFPRQPIGPALSLAGSSW